MLAEHYARLEHRYRVLEAVFKSDYSRVRTIGYGRLKRTHVLEGMLSTAWQTWCAYCALVVWHSVNGTVTKNGANVPSTGQVSSRGELAYIANQIKNGNAIVAGKTVPSYREPTWGDPSLLVDLINHTLPANSNQLKLGLNISTNAPDHMRIVRNASAHMSADNMTRVSKIAPYYVGTNVNHPLDLLLWQDTSHQEAVFVAWIYDLKDMAHAMVL
jgi:hypothetical protein